MVAGEGRAGERPRLRVLTEDEMKSGIDATTWQTLANHAAEIRCNKIISGVHEAQGKLERQVQALAEIRLSGGLPAYIKVEGVDGIVRQMPDGTRDLVELVDGAPVVVQNLSSARAIIET